MGEGRLTRRASEDLTKLPPLQFGDIRYLFFKAVIEKWPTLWRGGRRS